MITNSDTLRWSSPTPGLDSLIGCSGKDSTTRYFSNFYLDFRAQLPGPGGLGNEDSTWVLSFSMVVQLPGQFCADTIPISALAISDTGDSIPIVAAPDKSQGLPVSEMLDIDVEMILPINADGTVNSGGLAIIVETIDPKTSVVPELTEVFDWVGEVDDETFDIPAKEEEQSPHGLGNLHPVRPSCSVCQKPLDASAMK